MSQFLNQTRMILQATLLLVFFTTINHAQYERPVEPRIRSLDWSSTGNKIAAAIETSECSGFGAYVLNGASLNIETTLFDPYSCGGISIAFNSDGTELLIAEIVRITQWDLITEDIVSGYSIPAGFSEVQWNNQDTEILAVARPGLTLLPSRWQLDEDLGSQGIGPLRTLTYSGTWNNQSDVVAIGSDGIIYLWNIETNTEVTRFTSLDQQPIRYLAWHPTLNLLASGDDAGRILLWNTTTGQITAQLLGHIGGLRDLEWRPDGQQLASVGQDDTVRVWNYPSGQMGIAVSGQESWAIAYSPDSTKLVFGGEFEEGEPLNIQDELVSNITPVTCNTTVASGNNAALISAIQAGNSAGSAYVVCLGNGTFTLTASHNTADGGNGLPQITGNITLYGTGADIQRQSTAPAFRLLRVNTGARLKVQGVTLRGGAAGTSSGGGIRNLGTLELVNAIVENNTANSGAGIINNVSATLIATNSTIRTNTATTNGGGLMSNTSSSTTLTNTTFTGNIVGTSAGLGGGLFMTGATLTISGGTFSTNQARNGGAIFVNSVGTSASINGATFTGNTAANHGGAVYVNANTLSISDAIFTSNTAQVNGGAIHTTTGTTLNLTNVDVLNNTAQNFGGGLMSDGLFTITGSIFTGNNAVVRGGAIYAANGTNRSVQNSCLSANTAPAIREVNNNGTAALNASSNYWGAATGPVASQVSANVNTASFLGSCPN